MIVVVGITGYTGRMGQAIAEVCQDHPNTCLLGGVTRAHMVPENQDDTDFIITDNPEEIFPKCDVIVDFSHPTVTPLFARLAAKAGKPFLTGTTGLNKETIMVLEESAKEIPVLFTPNTSLSLIVASHITALAAALFKNFDYGISILDKHHQWKKDIPSGTAETLGNAVLTGNVGKTKPSYTSIRSGSIIGEHEVLFSGKGESIKITHSVTDRRVFARGAVEAAIWLAQQPAGYYSMDDMLKL